MQQRKGTWASLYLAIILSVIFALGGCGPQNLQGQDGQAIHKMVDSTKTEVFVPDHPKRMVLLGAGTVDIVYPMVQGDRIIAMTKAPSSIEAADKAIKGRVESSVEGIVSFQPDLVIAPSWMSPALINQLRAVNLNVYVYKVPTTLDGTVDLIRDLGAVVNEKDKADDLIKNFEAREKALRQFTSKIPDSKKKTAILFTGTGLAGGKGTTFALQCDMAGLIDGASSIGLDGSKNGGRESILKINPDIIFLPSKAYDNDKYKTPGIESLLNDPSLKGVTAIKNKAVYVVDARWLMTYSHYIMNSVESMAHDAYGYTPPAGTAP